MKKKNRGSFYHSISFQLTLIVFVTFMVTNLLSSGILNRMERPRVEGFLEDQLHRKLLDFQNANRGLGLSPEDAMEYFSDPSVEVRVYSSYEEIGMELTKEEIGRLENGEFLDFSPKRERGLPCAVGNIGGSLVVVSPHMKQNFASQFDRYQRLFLLVTILLGLILVWGVGYIAARKIRGVSKGAQEIAGGNFDIRLPERGKDEISELSHNFNVMAAELKANEYVHKEFVSSVSHEFKTPVSSINGYAKALREQELNSAKREEYLDIVISESERLSRLAANMLKLAELDNRVIKSPKQIISLDEQIREILIRMQNRWEEKQLDLELELEEIRYPCDEELMWNAWYNLIDNGIKYSPEGGRLRIHLCREGTRIHFSIQDEGPGIPEEEQEQIFQSFYKVDKSRNSQGSGLGLALVKKIITYHGGSIRVENGLSGGTGFHVELE